MNETEILGGCIGLVMVLIIITYWQKKKKQRRMKIDATVERVIRSNEPGYQPPGRRRMRMTIKDGVVTYRKDRSQEKKKEDGR